MKKFVCTVCGYVYEGEAAPAECPQCHVGADKFKEMTGETFHQYVIHRKMKAAAERIEEGGKSITQIATELGYDNFHYFARVFAREHGCTPSEYRKERKNV